MTSPSCIWTVAQYSNINIIVFQTLASVICLPPGRCQHDDTRCYFCSDQFNDLAIHVLIDCDFLKDVRESFWDEIFNVFDVNTSVYLYNVPEEILVNYMLGAYHEEMHEIISIVAKKLWLIKCMKKWVTNQINHVH